MDFSLRGDRRTDLLSFGNLRDGANNLGDKGFVPLSYRRNTWLI